MLLTYTGEPRRYYPTLGLTPEPGEQYEFADHPHDGRWLPEPPPAPAPEPEAAEHDQEPATADEPPAPAVRRRTKKEATDA